MNFARWAHEACGSKRASDPTVARHFGFGPGLKNRIAMQIISPHRSWWEKLKDRYRALSPQERQAILGGAFAVAVAFGGWMFLSKTGSGARMSMVATNVAGSALIQGNSNTVIFADSTHYGASTNLISRLPCIFIESLPGLPLGCTNAADLRVHRLVISNTNEVEIENFCSRLQLPEPITETLKTNRPAGTQIGWRPLLVGLRVNGSGGRSETGLWVGPASAVHFDYPEECFVAKERRGHKTEHSGPGTVTGIWELTVDKLPAGGHISLQFITSSAPEATNYIRFAREPLWQSPPDPQTIPDTNEVRFLFEGEYHYQALGKSGKQYFLVPLVFNEQQRSLSSLRAERSVGHWHPVTLELY